LDACRTHDRSGLAQIHLHDLLSELTRKPVHTLRCESWSPATLPPPDLDLHDGSVSRTRTDDHWMTGQCNSGLYCQHREVARGVAYLSFPAARKLPPLLDVQSWLRAPRPGWCAVALNGPRKIPPPRQDTRSHESGSAAGAPRQTGSIGQHDIYAVQASRACRGHQRLRPA
jgi:hypothetical protein